IGLSIWSNPTSEVLTVLDNAVLWATFDASVAVAAVELNAIEMADSLDADHAKELGLIASAVDQIVFAKFAHRQSTKGQERVGEKPLVSRKQLAVIHVDELFRTS
ncbi:MAG: hypothetical protein KDA87_08790, partial [Planctomycetales bacterium]|nr:hypothetical protein [Planctomycetales bacterium]